MRAALFLFVLFAAGCSSKAGEAGSCLSESNNSCTEYTAAQGAAGKRMCPTAWKAQSCPTEQRLGACTSRDGTRWMYGGPPNNYSAASAKSACEFSGGVFAATQP